MRVATYGGPPFSTRHAISGPLSVNGAGRVLEGERRGLSASHQLPRLQRLYKRSELQHDVRGDLRSALLNVRMTFYKVWLGGPERSQ